MEVGLPKRQHAVPKRDALVGIPAARPARDDWPCQDVLARERNEQTAAADAKSRKPHDALRRQADVPNAPSEA